MNYLDIDFPVELCNNFSSETEFSTSKTILKNKQEIRNQNWQTPRYKYNLIYKNCNEKLYQQLKSFFLICGGCCNSFNFFDKNDNKILLQQIAIGDGQTSSFEIYKNYSYDNISFRRKIHKTKNEKIYINNTLLSPTKYNINNGIINFKTNYLPENNDIISITCDFYIIVRFENDTLTITKKNNIIELNNLSLIEVNQ